MDHSTSHKEYNQNENYSIDLSQLNQDRLLEIPYSSSIDGDGSEIYDDDAEAEDEAEDDCQSELDEEEKMADERLRLCGYISSDSCDSVTNFNPYFSVERVSRKKRISAIVNRVAMYTREDLCILDTKAQDVLKKAKADIQDELLDIHDQLRSLELNKIRLETMFTEINSKIEQTESVNSVENSPYEIYQGPNSYVIF